MRLSVAHNNATCFSLLALLLFYFFIFFSFFFFALFPSFHLVVLVGYHRSSATHPKLLIIQYCTCFCGLADGSPRFSCQYHRDGCRFRVFSYLDSNCKSNAAATCWRCIFCSRCMYGVPGWFASRRSYAVSRFAFLPILFAAFVNRVSSFVFGILFVFILSEFFQFLHFFFSILFRGAVNCWIFAFAVTYTICSTRWVLLRVNCTRVVCDDFACYLLNV